MALNGTSTLIAQKQVLEEGEVEISQRKYNMIIGGMLMWGFLLNYVTVAAFGQQVVNMVIGMNPMVFLLLYLGLCIGGNVLITVGGPGLSFLGFNLIAVPIGMVLCIALSDVPPDIIQNAVLLTAMITLSFMLAATVFPEFFLRIGRVLLFSLIILIVGEVIFAVFFSSSPLVFEWLGAGIFSLYIGYDWARANACVRTVDNAIDISAGIYLDIVNLFLRIVRILAKSRSSSRR